MVDAPKAGDAPKGAAVEATKEPVGEAKATTYKVQTGDTFESIARSKLGDPKRQTEIAKLNPTVKANRMRVGQELEDRRSGADLDAKLRDAGILPGHASADDVLARLTAQDVKVVTPMIGQSVPASKDPA